MSGTGYDLSASIFSQDGRIYQIEYANKAIENAETIIGLKCKDGVILACEKIVNSPLEVRDGNHKIHNVNKNIGLLIGGKMADGKHILRKARKECESYLENFGCDISGPVLAERIANYIHAHTLYNSFRPFGCCVILASYDKPDFNLYMIENSGAYKGYFGCSNGKGRQTAKTYLEKFNGTTVKSGLEFVAKGIVSAHEEFKEKTYDMEISVIGGGYGLEHRLLEGDEKREFISKAEKELLE